MVLSRWTEGRTPVGLGRWRHFGVRVSDVRPVVFVGHHSIFRESKYLNMHLDLTDVIITTSSTSIESENCHWNLPVGFEELIVDGCMVGAGKVLPRVCLRRCGLSRCVAPHNAHYLVIRLWSCLN